MRRGTTYRTDKAFVIRQRSALLLCHGCAILERLLSAAVSFPLFLASSPRTTFLGVMTSHDVMLGALLAPFRFKAAVQFNNSGVFDGSYCGRLHVRAGHVVQVKRSRRVGTNVHESGLEGVMVDKKYKLMGFRLRMIGIIVDKWPVIAEKQ